MAQQTKCRKKTEARREAILDAALEEFAAKGYAGARMEDIARRAGVAKGTLYLHFGDKEGLFRAIAEPVVDQFKSMFRRVQEDFHQLSEEEQRADMGQYTARHQEEMLDYIYDHFDVFRLLLMRAEGTRYSSFLDDVVCLETRVTLKFFAELKSRGIQVHELAEEEWHILLHAYFASLAEVVMHNFPKEAALRYVHTLASFFNSGWQTVLGI